MQLQQIQAAGSSNMLNFLSVFIYKDANLADERRQHLNNLPNGLRINLAGALGKNKSYSMRSGLNR